MEDIQVFNNPEFGEIRTTVINDEVWFVGKDVAVALGYEKPRNALYDHVEDEDRMMGPENGAPSIKDSLGRTQYPIFINESGLYSITLSSKLPSAKKFKRWVTSEVLPSIRKTGGYMVSRQDDTPEMIMARALKVAEDTINRHKQQLEQANERITLQDAQLKEQAPKVTFADAILGSKNSCLVGELAKMLTKNNIIIGQNRLFKWLRENHFLGTAGERYNIHNQEYVERGLFELKKTVHDENGVMVSKVTPKVTAKGQQYFINGFLDGKFKIA